MKFKELGIWGGVIAVLIGGLWILVSAVNNSPSPSAPAAIKIPDVSKDDFAIGTPSAKVTLIEYGDFQCPACGAYYPFIKQLEAEFNNNLRVVYRFFPLTNIHQNAMLAAQVSYAAGLQNKFWEMHDILYENQNSWSATNPKNIFIDYAKKLGLDLDKFKKDADADSTKEFMGKAANNAISIGINSTPTFFVNGVHIPNPPDYQGFKRIIQDEIEAH
ncbi:MAG: thioredoxin domain-containing protein [Candidatus Levybacteria bacterium]|nr:thioredoxin domain-containing protein [Candidatus Levybacteria bacterium]